jgi:hypothetical protein
MFRFAAGENTIGRALDSEPEVAAVAIKELSRNESQTL